jgi:hypothetical protein
MAGSGWAGFAFWGAEGIARFRAFEGVVSLVAARQGVSTGFRTGVENLVTGVLGVVGSGEAYAVTPAAFGVGAWGAEALGERSRGYQPIDASIASQRRLRVTKGVYLPADVPMHGIFGSKDVIHS